MALISIPFTFSAGAVIIASQHNSNFTTISSDYNGNIDNNNIAPAAAIAYSKLNLSGSIVNADVSASAAIVASKLVLTSPGAIGTVAPGAIKATTLEATTTLKLGTTNQGDVLYDNGTSLVRLTPGTNGQFLKTQGASANPLWATLTIPPGLGTWASATQGAATQATTDGFIVGFSAEGGGNYTSTIKTDSSNPPTTVTSKAKWIATGAADVTIPLFTPVKKNDYYLIEHTGSGSITAYFIPIGS